MIKQKYHISKIDANQRVDKYIKKVLPLAPKNFVYKLFRRKDISINNFTALPDSILKENDEVSVYLTDEQLNDFSREYYYTKMPMTAKIIFEDENILVLDKPRGLLVHSTVLQKKETLANQVLTYLEEKGEFDSKKRGFVPSPVNRLDQPTSGVVIFAKTLIAAQVLAETFADSEALTRKYLAICSGKLQKSGVINVPLTRRQSNLNGTVVVDENGKEAVTKYNVVKYYKNFSLVNIEIFSGRTNQIRVHMAYIMHPILGDTKYGDSALNDAMNVRQLCLHCSEIRLNKVREPLAYLTKAKFNAEVPHDFKEIVKRLLAKGAK
jgi:RluA family pseudouridine synthase